MDYRKRGRGIGVPVDIAAVAEGPEVIRVARPANLAWTEGRFCEVPHGLGPRVAICRVEIPADVVVPQELLERKEIERAVRMSDSAEKGYLLGSHAVLRSVLAATLGRSLTRLELSSDEFGKPRLADGSLHFNMSRSKSVALIGFSTTLEIGVDIEVVGEVPDVASLAREHFSTREHDEWSRLDAASAIPAFLRCWCRKEACVKAVGIGLGMPLRQVDVGWVADGVPSRLTLTHHLGRWDVLVTSLPMPPGLVAAAAVIT